MARRAYPLLEVKAALADAARALADAQFYLEVLLHDTASAPPPDAQTCVQNLQAARTLLPALVPGRLAEAISQEQAGYDAAQAYCR